MALESLFSKPPPLVNKNCEPDTQNEESELAEKERRELQGTGHKVSFWDQGSDDESAEEGEVEEGEETGSSAASTGDTGQSYDNGESCGVLHGAKHSYEGDMHLQYEELGGKGLHHPETGDSDESAEEETSLPQGHFIQPMEAQQDFAQPMGIGDSEEFVADFALPVDHQGSSVENVSRAVDFSQDDFVAQPEDFIDFSQTTDVGSGQFDDFTGEDIVDSILREAAKPLTPEEVEEDEEQSRIQEQVERLVQNIGVDEGEYEDGEHEEEDRHISQTRFAEREEDSTREEEGTVQDDDGEREYNGDGEEKVKTDETVVEEDHRVKDHRRRKDYSGERRRDSFAHEKQGAVEDISEDDGEYMEEGEEDVDKEEQAAEHEFQYDSSKEGRYKEEEDSEESHAEEVSEEESSAEESEEEKMEQEESKASPPARSEEKPKEDNDEDLEEGELEEGEIDDDDEPQEVAPPPEKRRKKETREERAERKKEKRKRREREKLKRKREKEKRREKRRKHQPKTPEKDKKRSRSRSPDFYGSSPSYSDYSHYSDYDEFSYGRQGAASRKRRRSGSHPYDSPYEEDYFDDFEGFGRSPQRDSNFGPRGGRGKGRGRGRGRGRGAGPPHGRGGSMMSMLEGDDMDINIAANEGESFADHHRGARGRGGPGRGRGRGRGGMGGPPMKMRGRGRGGRPTVLCKFWMEGRCAKGQDCTFSHDAQPYKKQEMCKFYLQGYCAKGDQCLFIHGSFPCKFYHTGKPCYQDENCRFSHEPLTDETRALLDKYLAREQEEQELRRQEDHQQQQQQQQDNEQDNQLPPPPPMMQQEPYRGPMPPPKGVGLLPTPNIPPDPHANDPRPPKIPSLFEIKVEPPKKLMHPRFFGEAVSPTQQGVPPGPPMAGPPGPGSLAVHAQQTAGFYNAFYSQQGDAEPPEENEGWNEGEENIKPILKEEKVETEEVSDHGKEDESKEESEEEDGDDQGQPPPLEQSQHTVQETQKTEQEEKGGETTETAPEESSAKESESDTEGKKMEVAGGPDLSHMPHRQRALFLRIQQKQHQESLDKEGKAEEKKPEEKQEEDWYSSEEDDEDDRDGEESEPLTNILRTLRQQASALPPSNLGGSWPSGSGGSRPRSVWGEEKQEPPQNSGTSQPPHPAESWPADPRPRQQGLPHGTPAPNWPRVAQAPESQVPNHGGQAWPADPRRTRDPRAQVQDPRAQGARSTDPRMQPQANNKILDPRTLSRDEDFEEPDEPTTPMTPTTPGGGHRLLSQPAIIPLEPQSHQVDPRLATLNHLQPRQVVLEQLVRYGQSGDARTNRTAQSDPRLVRSQSDPRLLNGQAGKPQDPRARGGSQQGSNQAASQLEQSRHPVPNHRVEEDVRMLRGPRMQHPFGRQAPRQPGPSNSPPQFLGGPVPPVAHGFPGGQVRPPFQGNQGRERFPGNHGGPPFGARPGDAQFGGTQGAGQAPPGQGGPPFPANQGGACFPGAQGIGQVPSSQSGVQFPGSQTGGQFGNSQSRQQFLSGQAAQLARSDPRLARQGSDPQPLQKPFGDPRLQRKGSLPAQPTTSKAADPRLARLQGAPDPRLQRQSSREKGQDPRLARQGRLPPEQTGEPTIKPPVEKAAEKSEPSKLAPYDPRLLSGSLKSSSGAKPTSSTPTLPPYDPRAMNKGSSSGSAASGSTSQRKFVIPKAASTADSQARMTRQGLDRGQHSDSSSTQGDNTAKYNAYNRPRPRPPAPTVTSSGPLASAASSVPSTSIHTPVISMYGSAKPANNPQAQGANRSNQAKDESLKDVFKTFDPTASPFGM